MDQRTARIRELNDSARRNIFQERALITPGVAALGPSVVDRIVRTVMTFDNFTSDIDPYGEGDFGSLNVEGTVVFFKLDYYDLQLEFHSPDPADANVTTRVITIMLGSEY